MSVIRIEDGQRESILAENTPEQLEIFVGKGASLDYYILESQSQGQCQCQCQCQCQIRIHQDEDSNVSLGVFSLGGKKTQHDIRIDLDGTGAKTKLYGAVIADGDEEVVNVTYIDHKVPSCQSNELFKYILNDAARGSFFGRIHVAHGAFKTDAHQTVRTLCLTDRSRMQAKPELEIYADDVKCSHGATVGQLDQNALFYMRTRGIPESDARRLLMLAFVDDVLANVRDEKIREELCRMIETRLN